MHFISLRCLNSVNSLHTVNLFSATVHLRETTADECFVTGRGETAAWHCRLCYLFARRVIGDQFQHLFNSAYHVVNDTFKICVPRFYQQLPNAVNVCTLMTLNYRGK